MKGEFIKQAQKSTAEGQSAYPPCSQGWAILVAREVEGEKDAGTPKLGRIRLRGRQARQGAY